MCVCVCDVCVCVCVYVYMCIYVGAYIYECEVDVLIYNLREKPPINEFINWIRFYKNREVITTASTWSGGSTRTTLMLVSIVFVLLLYGDGDNDDNVGDVSAVDLS